MRVEEGSQKQWMDCMNDDMVRKPVTAGITTYKEEEEDILH